MDRWTGLEAGTQSTSESTIFLYSLVSLISNSKDVNSYIEIKGNLEGFKLIFRRFVRTHLLIVLNIFL